MSSRGSSTIGRAIAVFAVVVGFAACSTSTTITQEWKSPTYAAGPMTNVLVVGARLDPAQRRTLEDDFASALRMHGVRATPSYTLFPDGMPDKAEAADVVHKNAFDGVLVSVLRGISEVTYIDVRTGWSGGFFDGYWGPGWAGPPPPPQSQEDVKFETSLWDPHGKGKLVWMAVTQTENPASGPQFGSSLVKSVAPALAKSGLIPPPTTTQPAPNAGAPRPRYEARDMH
jgi:hypothetical protein